MESNRANRKMCVNKKEDIPYRIEYSESESLYDYKGGCAYRPGSELKVD